MATASAPVAPYLTIVRRLKAPPPKIYAALTDPGLIAHWWGPEGARVIRAEADVRVGGRYSVVFTEGSERHQTHGIYREVQPNERLCFTWQWITMPERQSLVTLLLRPIEDGTELTLIHERFFDEAVRDAHHAGWSGSLDKLETLVATL